MGAVVFYLKVEIRYSENPDFLLQDEPVLSRRDFFKKGARLKQTACGHGAFLLQGQMPLQISICFFTRDQELQQLPAIFAELQQQPGFRRIESLLS